MWKFVFRDKTTQRIKPCVYTYIIQDDAWRFSETTGRFLSKHVVLTNCSENVCYAGEFHPRPKYGWNRLDDEWELVFDNGSSTYAPDANFLTNLKELLLLNFPELNVVTYDCRDPKLQQSIEQLKVAAEKCINDDEVTNE